MKYLIGTSYFDKGKGGSAFRLELMRHWIANVQKADAKPERIVIIAENDSMLPAMPCGSKDIQVVSLPGDLGHVGQHLNGSKRYEFTGWSASMLSLAMMAYLAECDFVYQESDCLAFGPRIKRMYADMGDTCMVFGGKMQSAPYMPCAQALFMVRHSFIPTMIRTYLGLGRDGDVRSLGEQKFVRIEERYGPSLVRRLSFGVDRERPIPWDSEVFYFQQPSEDEIAEAKKRGLI